MLKSVFTGIEELTICQTNTMSTRSSFFRTTVLEDCSSAHEAPLRRLSGLFPEFDDSSNNGTEDGDDHELEPGMDTDMSTESQRSFPSEKVPRGSPSISTADPTTAPPSPLLQPKRSSSVWDEKPVPLLLRTYTIPHSAPGVCEGEPQRHDSIASIREYATSYLRPIARRGVKGKRKPPRVTEVPGPGPARGDFYVILICAAQICVYADIGSALSVLTPIAATFGITHVRDLSWAVAGYAMGVGASILVAGRLGEIFGHKRVFLFGLTWSALWYAITGLSFYATATVLITSRVLEGLGAGLLLPAALTLLDATYPSGRRKDEIFFWVAFEAPVGLITGAVWAAALTLAWWPLVYWAFALAFLVIACLGAFVIPNPLPKTRTKMSIVSIKQFDIPRMITGMSLLLLMGFSGMQGATVGWYGLDFQFALICGLLLVSVFICIEGHCAPKPFLPCLALSQEVTVILGVVACGWLCFGIWFFYTWQIVETWRSEVPPHPGKRGLRGENIY
ncbi:major facilitator superfamily-domain-containing protein [Camillea tinctor]|nr:major facilitator superfamily-domain-containing protein [Camillea tinctor]